MRPAVGVRSGMGQGHAQETSVMHPAVTLVPGAEDCASEQLPSPYPRLRNTATVVLWARR